MVPNEEPNIERKGADVSHHNIMSDEGLGQVQDSCVSGRENVVGSHGVIRPIVKTMRVWMWNVTAGEIWEMEGK